MFILKMLRVTPEGVVPIAINPGLPATFFMCSCSTVLAGAFKRSHATRAAPTAPHLQLLFSQQLLSFVRVFDVGRGQRLVQHLDKGGCGA